MGVCVDDRWAELYVRIAESYMNLGKHQKAIPYLHLALELDGYPPTGMWVRENFYDEIPRKHLIACYDWLGDKRQVNYYKNKVDKDPKVIELVRQGALGDIIATTPSVEWFRKTYPNAHIRYVCHTSCAEAIENNPDIDEVAHAEGRCDARYYFKYPMDKGYPDVPMSKHLVEHFADSSGAKLGDKWQCKLVIPEDVGGMPSKLRFANYVCFSVKTDGS